MPHRKVPDHEAAVEEQQELLAVELVREARGQDAGDAGGKGVGRHDQAELAGGDVQVGHEDGAQGAHDHEVQHHGELQERQHGDHEFLVGGEGGCGRLRGGCFHLIPRRLL